MRSSPEINLSFAHAWEAEILPARPLILPQRQYVYPADVEEAERGALEVLVRPRAAAPFLATCALGFASQGVPSGIWGCPHPAWMCAAAGGYAYLINTRTPEVWEQVEYRPVTAVRALPAAGLLVFAGFRSLLAWGRAGRAWQTGRLSWDGVRLTEVRGDELLGLGWDLHRDREVEFVVDLRTGTHRGGGYLEHDGSSSALRR